MDFLAASNAAGAAGGDCLENCLLVLAVGWPDTSAPDQTAAAYRTGLRRLEAEQLLEHAASMLSNDVHRRICRACRAPDRDRRPGHY
jgi:hypothetical protein